MGFFIKNKKGIAMSFNWLFALIVGAVILFLAIYGATRLINTGQGLTSTESAAKLAGLLDSAKAGIASGSSESIEFKKNTRTYYRCEESGVFGEQTIAFAEETFNKFNDPGNEILIIDKYIFANELVEGDLNIFSQPFHLPFKVADLLFISSETYCFRGTVPSRVEAEIRNLDNMIFVKDISVDCEGIDVCFGSSCLGAEIAVSGDATYESGFVNNNGTSMWYVGSLLYGAIVSSPSMYECTVERLMKKTKQLVDLYNKKISIMGCGENLVPDLSNLKSQANSLDDSGDLASILLVAKDIDYDNRAGSSCGVY